MGRSSLSDPKYRRKSDRGELSPISHVRVLIVDDDEAYRVYLRTLVRRLGCHVATANDGADALAKLGVGAFDLLLSDLEMPKLNGLDLIEHVRAHAGVGSIYAVMITSRGDVQSKMEALARGYDDFLSKSAVEVEVAARIAAAQRMLDRERVRDEEIERWRSMAMRDELTGVGTRRIFADRAAAILAEGRSTAVLLFDLDEFKHINDTHGHLTGDRILRDVGALLLNNTRREDVVARYGGDEFVLVVPDIDLEEATSIAGRLAADLTQLCWLVGTETVRITACTGVAHSSLLETCTVDVLFDAADRELYAKKFLRKHPPVASEEVYEYPPSDSPIVAMPMVPPAQREKAAEEEV
jgi:two-component system, cell cycle response regulator